MYINAPNEYLQYLDLDTSIKRYLILRKEIGSLPIGC